MRDGEGRLAAAPLQFDGRCCLFHANVFSTRKAYLEGRSLTYFLDFETTGLDVVLDSIVEAGIISETGAAFATVIRPPVIPSEPACSDSVHGIAAAEEALVSSRKGGTGTGGTGRSSAASLRRGITL